MPTYELTTPAGKVFHVDAADIGMAQKALDHAFGGGASGAGQPQPDQPGSGQPGAMPFLAPDDPSASRATQERFGGYNGVQTEGGPEAPLGYELTRRADERLVGPDSATNRVSNTVINAANTLGMGLPQNIGVGIATALGKGRSFRENFTLAEDQLKAMGRQSPGARDLGVAGGIVGSFGLPVASPFSAATMQGRVGNTAATVGGYSGVTAAAEEGLDRIAEPETIAKALGHAASGAALGGVTHGFIEGAAPWLARARDWLTAEPTRAGVPAAVPEAFPKGVTPAVAREAEAGQFGIDLTRGQATGNYAEQASESMLARGGGDAPPARMMREFLEGQERQVSTAKGDIGRRLAGGEDVVERPYDAGVKVSDFARNSQRMADAVAAGEEIAAARASASLAPADPINAAASVAAGVRGRAAADKARYQAGYDDVATLPGRFEPGVFDKVGNEVRSAIEAESVFVDPTLTPAAHRALAMLDDIPNLRLAGVSPQPAGVLGAPARPARPVPPQAGSGPIGGEAGSSARAPAMGDSIILPSGQRVGVEYRVVDASKLKTSHTADFAPDPAYPSSLQPRDRSRAAAERQVQEIAADLKPEWLGASPSAREGAPIIGPDGVVESGNGRVMCIRRAYAVGGESGKRYQEWLRGQGYDVAGMKEPVLVRTRTTDLSPAERVAFTQEANASAGLSMGAAEKAASDAQRLPAGALDLFQGGDVADVGNREFVRVFVKSIPKGEEGALVTKAGGLSLEGEQRLRTALLHSAYGDSHLVASLAEVGDDTIKAFGRVLQDVAPDVAKLKNAIAGGYVAPGADLSKPLLEAAQLVQAARQRGLKLPEAVAQQDAFSKVSPEADAVLRLVYGENLTGRVNRDRAAMAMRSAIGDASQQVNEAGLFGQGPLSAADILTAKAAKGSVADAAPATGTGKPGDPVRMTAAEFRAMQAGEAAVPGAAPAAAAAPAEMTSGALDMRGVDQARKRLVAAYSAAKSSGNATDMRAVSSVIKAFDDRVEAAMSDGLFSGSDEVLTRLREARSLFRDYQRTYRPQGAGDDVGQAMRKIIERDAQPQEVANLLFGTSLTGNTGSAMRLADRLKGVLPEPLWQRVQQGYLGRVIGDGVDNRKIVDNIQRALSGEGRGITFKLLADAQVAGLRSIQSALRTAAAAREAVPEWVRTLGKSDFEPKSVVDSLFGKSTVTGNTASIQYAKGVRDLVGAESETWAAVRQAGWQHLVTKPEGSTADFGPQAIANRLSNFLEKEGRGLAGLMFTAEERSIMKAFANTMKTLTPARIAGGSASPNSDTAPMLMRSLETLQRHEGKLNMLLSTVGFVSGGPAGAAAAYGVAKGAGAVAGKLAERRALTKAAEAVSGAPAAPIARAPRPAPAVPAFQNPLSRLLEMAY